MIAVNTNSRLAKKFLLFVWNVSRREASQELHREIESRISEINWCTSFMILQAILWFLFLAYRRFYCSEVNQKDCTLLLTYLLSI